MCFRFCLKKCVCLFPFAVFVEVALAFVFGVAMFFVVACFVCCCHCVFLVRMSLLLCLFMLVFSPLCFFLRLFVCFAFVFTFLSLFACSVARVVVVAFDLAFVFALLFCLISAFVFTFVSVFYFCCC